MATCSIDDIQKRLDNGQYDIVMKIASAKDTNNKRIDGSCNWLYDIVSRPDVCCKKMKFKQHDIVLKLKYIKDKDKYQLQLVNPNNIESIKGNDGKELPIIKEVIKEVPKIVEVERIKEVIKEVPKIVEVEKIKEVIIDNTDEVQIEQLKVMTNMLYKLGEIQDDVKDANVKDILQDITQKLNSMTEFRDVGRGNNKPHFRVTVN